LVGFKPATFPYLDLAGLLFVYEPNLSFSRYRKSTNLNG